MQAHGIQPVLLRQLDAGRRRVSGDQSRLDPVRAQRQAEPEGGELRASRLELGDDPRDAQDLVGPLVMLRPTDRPPAPPGEDAAPQESLWDFKGRGQRIAVIGGRRFRVERCGRAH
jgi:hypothetical protein